MGDIDHRYSGMQNQASELIEQAFNRGFKAGLEEAKKRNKSEETMFIVGNVVRWRELRETIRYGIVTGINYYGGTELCLNILCSDGTYKVMSVNSIGLELYSSGYATIRSCLKDLKFMEEKVNQND